MKKVKPGDTVEVDGQIYKFGENSTLAFNVWVDLYIKNHKISDSIGISLYTKNGSSSRLIPLNKILAALAEKK